MARAGVTRRRGSQPALPQPGGPAAAAGLARWRWAARLWCLGLALTFAYQAMARYDSAKELQFEGGSYVDIYQGRPLGQIWSPPRWRVLLPWAASKLPGLPQALTLQYRGNGDETKMMRLRFGVLNALGLSVAAACLMSFMEGLGFGFLGACLGGLFFMTSHQVVLNGTSMLVDAWPWAAVMGCLLLAQRDRLWSAALVFGVGLFAKETVVVALPMAWLLGPRRRGALAGLMVLAAVPYLCFRLLLFPGGPGWPYTWHTPMEGLGDLASPRFLVYLAGEFTLNFFMVAPLAWLGWREARGPQAALRPMAWVLPALAIGPALVLCEYSREWFLGFPVFIPLAVLGLRRLAGTWSLAGATTASV